MIPRLTLLAVLLSSVIFLGCAPAPFPGDGDQSVIYIGSWNLQRLGDAKAGNPELLSRYAAIIRDFDIFIVQEVTDKDGSAFSALCETVGENHSCLLSSRAGSTSYKEQYGVVYRDGLLIVDTVDYALLNASGFERPPYAVTMNASGYVLTLYTIHTKPEAATEEIRALDILVHDSLAEDSGNAVVLGDLNADCSYYRRGDEFRSWRWVIDRDTTAGKSDCAYDRILLNGDASREYRSSGVLPVGGDGISDHNAVWVALNKGER